MLQPRYSGRADHKDKALNLWLFSELVFNQAKDSAICGCRFGTNEGGNHEALVREARFDEAEAAGGDHCPTVATTVATTVLYLALLWRHWGMRVLDSIVPTRQLL